MAKLGDIFVKQIVGEWGNECNNESNGVFVLRTTNFSNSGVINYDKVVKRDIPDNKVEEKKLKYGDIILEKSGGTDKTPVGRVVFCDNKIESDVYLCNNFTQAMRVDNSIAIPKYVFYLMYYFHQIGITDLLQSKTTGIRNLRLRDYLNTDIKLPNLAEQEHCVIYLDKLTVLISLRQQQLEKLDELVKSRFIEMFGEIGTDKFGWGLFKIGDLCIINPKKSDDTRLSSELDVSFVPMPAVSEHGDIDTSETRKYDEVKTGFTYFADDDVLFAKITPCMENGKGCVARHLCNGIGFGSTEFHVLRPTNKVNSVWVYAVTSFPKFREDAANNMTGSAGQRRVPAVFLEHYKITLPPIELQEQFAAFVEQTDKSKVAVQASITKCHYLTKKGVNTHA